MTRTAQPAAKASEVESADTVRKVVAKVGEFPALLPVVQKALALVEQPAVTTLHLQRILSADPVMVSRVLRLANSAYFGVMAEVTTVSMAINIIGFHRLRSLLRHILVSGLLELLSHGRPAATVLRQLAIAASVASHEVAARDGEDDPEELLVAGLLVNVGSLALCWTFPKEYDSAWQQSAAAGREPPSIVLGVNPESMGRRVLEAWRFPIVCCEIVEKWPRPSGETTDAALRRSCR